jgi:hypothetical protein
LQVEYDFEYYKLEMATDVQMLTLSEGKSNILPSDLVVPFRPSTVPAVTATPEELESWRWYLATVRSLPQSNEPEILQVTIPQSTSYLADSELSDSVVLYGVVYTCTELFLHLDCRRSKMKWSMPCVKIGAWVALNLAGMVLSRVMCKLLTFIFS